MEDNRLEKLLYFFVCDDEKKRSKLYKTNKIMKKVVKKAESLTDNFLDGLYYDFKEYKKEEAHELGFEEGKLTEKNKIAKTMLVQNYTEEEIIKITGLTKEELENLK